MRVSVRACVCVCARARAHVLARCPAFCQGTCSDISKRICLARNSDLFFFLLPFGYQSFQGSALVGSARFRLPSALTAPLASLSSTMQWVSVRRLQ